MKQPGTITGELSVSPPKWLYALRLLRMGAKVEIKWPWAKKPPRAWFTISRAGQRTDDNHTVTLTAIGGPPGEWARQSVYTRPDTPPGNAEIEMLGKTLAKITGLTIRDERKTPWNYPRDGIAPVGTLPVWFDLGDLVKERVEYRQVNGWWHRDVDEGDAPSPPLPEFSIPGYTVEGTLDGRWIAIPAREG